MTHNELQKQCFQWFKYEYPAHVKLLCYNLNNSSDKIEGYKNRDMALQAGRSDLVLYFDGKATHIEIKTGGGNLSDAQIDWSLAVMMQGFEYYVIRSLVEFQKLIRKIIT